MTRVISIEDCGDQFGLPSTTCHRVINRTVSLINTYIAPRLIFFPDEEELRNLSALHCQRNRLKGIFAALDGSHIPVQATFRKPERYINRKGWHSIVVQLVVDHKCVIRHWCSGFPGSTHDARVFVHSDLPDLGKSIPPNFYIVADAAYPIRPWLITPFKGAALTQLQSDFNYYQSASRMYVEMTLGMFKGRFRRFRYPTSHGEAESSQHLLLSAAAIHSWIQREGSDSAYDFLESYRKDHKKFVFDESEAESEVLGLLEETEAAQRPLGKLERDKLTLRLH